LKNIVHQHSKNYSPAFGMLFNNYSRLRNVAEQLFPVLEYR